MYSYEIIFSESFISKTEAESLLAFVSSEASIRSTSAPSGTQYHHDAEPTEGLSQRILPQGDDGSQKALENDNNALTKTYESMRLRGREYLCTIPIVETVPKNETAEADARAEEEKELARAATRGWELLQAMNGHCMYFLSGWWSYEFCYNAHVKQFHQQPPQRGLPPYTPLEDPATPSYILGRARNRDDGDDWEYQEPRNDISESQRHGDVDATELQVKGETRYLVQKLGAGTVCDLTGKDRRVEIQFRCNPHSSDRIGWIKEVTTCAYLMVVETPRLCDDVAFLPPRHNQAHPVACREVLRPEDIPDWHARKAAEAEHELLKGLESFGSNDEGNTEQQQQQQQQQRRRPLVVGGVKVGAKVRVGEGRRIESGANVPGIVGSPDVIATSNGKGGPVKTANEEKLKRLELTPETVKKLRDELQEIAGDKGWKLEVVEQEGGTKQFRYVVDAEEDEKESTEEGSTGGGTSGDGGNVEDGEDEAEKEGSEEGYYEEL
ncbi:MAG: Protein OS-9 [Sclerophora amabilis]|nr:MAG: Protein OS-9 [Sclerophora amabilis]